MPILVLHLQTASTAHQNIMHHQNQHYTSKHYAPQNQLHAR